ncbi:hypothetical protein GS464_29515 [Rhodococcus hoagii]|nr:hypothetical protein [Prescottella equi]
MNLSPRDAQIIALVGRFGQVSTGQISRLVFAANKSETPCRRVLARLVEHGMLRRMGERPRGGWAMGSSQYVYQLGSKGWNYLRREGKHQPYRTLDSHRLQIAEAYTLIVLAERAGDLLIQEVITEPDNWVEVGQADIRPDLYVCFDLPKGVRRRVWLEIDMGTERRAKITGKLAGYRHAYRFWGDMEMFGGYFPHVAFIAMDDERARELAQILGEIPEEPRKLFSVRTVENIHTLWQ